MTSNTPNVESLLVELQASLKIVTDQCSALTQRVHTLETQQNKRKARFFFARRHKKKTGNPVVPAIPRPTNPDDQYTDQILEKMFDEMSLAATDYVHGNAPVADFSRADAYQRLLSVPLPTDETEPHVILTKHISNEAKHALGLHKSTGRVKFRIRPGSSDLSYQRRLMQEGVEPECQVISYKPPNVRHPIPFPQHVPASLMLETTPRPRSKKHKRVGDQQNTARPLRTDQFGNTAFDLDAHHRYLTWVNQTYADPVSDAYERATYAAGGDY